MNAWIVIEVEVEHMDQAMDVAEDIHNLAEVNTGQEASIAYVVPAKGPRVHCADGHTGVVLGEGQIDFKGVSAGEFAVWPDFIGYEPRDLRIFSHWGPTPYRRVIKQAPTNADPFGGY